ncbi:outer membrane protein [Martelella soudanensis]|uniref:outer membrane protein n=1 Tax=unclassified Martelella TaxID=2629616 RepID=UPI0015DDCADB|nr:MULTISPECIES: outer membrane beta-barrel protein [unclassified Martelella]
MKLFPSAALAALLTAPAAGAADITVPAAPQPQPTTGISWSGFYLGAEGGYGWLAGKIPETVFTAGATEAASGGTAGLFIGYDHQFDNRMVIGVEGSYGYNWNDNSYTVSSPLPILNGQSVTFGTEWRATVEGRLGYAWGPALVYATGGFASTRLEGSFSLTGQDYDDVLNGWTAGLGVDYAFSEHVFGRLKATYSDYGNTDLVTRATGLPGLAETKLTQASLTAGIGFRF